MNRTFAFFETKPYDRVWFERLAGDFDITFRFIENKLNRDTAYMADGCEGVVAFVNDMIDKETVEKLCRSGIKLLAMRSTGYNNVDLKAAKGKLRVVNVPAYSPYAIAEFAMALLFTLNRKTHRAYFRTRDYNFNIDGFTGFDLHGKTMGVVGTGKIGRVFIDICRGIGMNVLAYDPFPAKDTDIRYVELKELFKQSDVISLHCPLTKETHHMIDKKAISSMKPGVILINTSRGALIDSDALLDAIKSHAVGGAGLDVYEEEENLFYEDYSNTIIQDDMIVRLLSMPNVIITSHQAFLTDEALENIARITLENIRSYYEGGKLQNEVMG